MRYSRTEVLRHKDFAAYSHGVRRSPPPHGRPAPGRGAAPRSRRLRPARRTARRPDLRRTVRRALRAGGEPVRRAWLAARRRPRRVVLLCDVSGSMEPYARALLRFRARRCRPGRQRVEAFALGTRLTRITRELSWRDPDAAIADAAQAVADWSGGTRLGDGLRRVQRRVGRAGMARGAVVVILSDGWDRGDPEQLAEQMARLHRVAHRVVWVNPLKAAPGYARWPAGWRRPSRTLTTSSKAIRWPSLEELAAVVAGARPRKEETDERGPQRHRPLAGGRQAGSAWPGWSTSRARGPVIPAPPWP